MNLGLQVKQSQHEARVPVTVLELAGEMDASTVQLFQAEAQQALEAGTHYVLLDLSQLMYISSSGLRALFVLAKALSAKGGTASGSHAAKTGSFKSPYLKLSNPMPNVREVLDKMGFTMSIEIHGDRNEAIASF